jgi:hypothetical protein
MVVPDFSGLLLLFWAIATAGAAYVAMSKWGNKGALFVLAFALGVPATWSIYYLMEREMVTRERETVEARISQLCSSNSRNHVAELAKGVKELAVPKYLHSNMELYFLQEELRAALKSANSASPVILKEVVLGNVSPRPENQQSPPRFRLDINTLANDTAGIREMRISISDSHTQRVLAERVYYRSVRWGYLRCKIDKNDAQFIAAVLNP